MKIKRVLFLGVPGCGKGEQVELLKQYFQVIPVSASGILGGGTSAGTRVPDEEVVPAFECHLNEIGYFSPNLENTAFVHDGMVRSKQQAEWFRRIHTDEHGRFGRGVAIVTFGINTFTALQRMVDRFRKNRDAGTPRKEETGRTEDQYHELCKERAKDWIKCREAIMKVLTDGSGNLQTFAARQIVIDATPSLLEVTHGLVEKLGWDTSRLPVIEKPNASSQPPVTRVFVSEK